MKTIRKVLRHLVFDYTKEEIDTEKPFAQAEADIKAIVKGIVDNSKLVKLLQYGFPRGVGHTYSEINGVKNNPNSILIVANEAQKQHIDLPKERMVSIQTIPESLRGKNKAVVIDHFALVCLIDLINKNIESEGKL